MTGLWMEPTREGRRGPSPEMSEDTMERLFGGSPPSMLEIRIDRTYEVAKIPPPTPLIFPEREKSTALPRLPPAKRKKLAARKKARDGRKARRNNRRR
ncbi:MAG TPA: hypothetical protein VJA87_02040 [Candidatus Paceibacterota bacterium]